MRGPLVRGVRRGTFPAAVVGLLTVALALAQPGGAVVSGLTAGFLLAAPALAVALPLGTLDPAARTVVALGAAATVDTLVAQSMLAADAWSLRGGLVAVGAVSALTLLVLTKWLPGRTTSTGGTGGGTHPGRAGSEPGSGVA